jgi:Xaa-Pro aminopeptidase
VLCDFGGTMHGYCSDITRMFSVGEPTAEVQAAYAVLVEAQERGVRAATVGTACEAVDAATRDVIDDGGYGEFFVHRTGHGIGTEAHEDPYVVSGNRTALAPGHAFSIEPGIYLPGRFGLRLEDIVVATPAGPERLNEARRDLAIVD